MIPEGHVDVRCPFCRRMQPRWLIEHHIATAHRAQVVRITSRFVLAGAVVLALLIGAGGATLALRVVR